MSTRTRRQAPSSGQAAPTTTGQTTGESNQDVVLYLSLNNTTHKQDELPETLAALKQAEAEGLGHRELLPISDPYATKQAGGGLSFHDDTYDYAFGEQGADRFQWWHGNDQLQDGQVMVDGQTLTLGTDNLDMEDAQAQAQVQTDWRTALAAGGMDKPAIDACIDALFKDKDGNFQKLASGDGATNELVQFMMAMHRAEKGEITVSSIVFSGHHWRGEEGQGGNELDDRYGGHGIWGEVAGGDHEYDNASDFFSLVDVANLKDAFPNAYKQVKSVQLAACNTDALGIADETGKVLTTNEYLQDTFENIQMSSYWKQVLAPVAAAGFASNGEFVLDAMRHEAGRDGVRDARMNAKGLKRSILNGDGDLEEITMKTSRASYGAHSSVGLKGSSRQDFDDRTDLAGHVFSASTLEQTDLSAVEAIEEEVAPVEEQTTTPSMGEELTRWLEMWFGRGQ